MRLAGLVVLCLASLSLRGQTLPQIRGTAVSGRAHVLPDELKGRVAVLIVGFSRSCSQSAGAWAGRFKSDFGNNGGLVVLQLPFLEEVPRLFRGLAKSGVEKSAVPNRDEVIPIFESEASYKQLVHYCAPDDAYVLIVDRAGTIRGQFSGDVADQYAGAKERVRQLLFTSPLAATP